MEFVGVGDSGMTTEGAIACSEPGDDVTLLGILTINPLCMLGSFFPLALMADKLGPLRCALRKTRTLDM